MESVKVLNPIQCSITGYFGKPSTVYSIFDDDAGILVIQVEASAYSRARRDGCALLTNDVDVTDRDCWVSTDSMKSGIEAYYALRNTVSTLDTTIPTLKFGERAARCNPESVIERDGYDEQGARYRLAENVSNGHIAVLATCAYVAKLRGVAKAVNAVDSIAEKLMKGQAQTIGGEAWYEKRVFAHGVQADPRFFR